MTGAATDRARPDAESQFRDALADRNIVPPQHLVADGALHRCDAVGRGLPTNDQTFLAGRYPDVKQSVKASR